MYKIDARRFLCCYIEKLHSSCGMPDFSNGSASVSAENDVPARVISSAEEIVPAVLPTSITGGAIGMEVDAKSAILIDAAAERYVEKNSTTGFRPPV
jgi:hypothetical protein